MLLGNAVLFGITPPLSEVLRLVLLHPVRLEVGGDGEVLRRLILRLGDVVILRKLRLAGCLMHSIYWERKNMLQSWHDSSPPGSVGRGSCGRGRS